MFAHRPNGQAQLLRTSESFFIFEENALLFLYYPILDVFDVLFSFFGKTHFNVFMIVSGVWMEQMLWPEIRRMLKVTHRWAASGRSPLFTLASLIALRSRVYAENENVTSAGWQVTLCDPIWHVSSQLISFTLLICTARMVQAYMQSRVYATVGLRRPSMCLPHSPALQKLATGLLLWARRVGDFDRLLQQRRANAGSGTLSACVGSGTRTRVLCRSIATIAAVDHVRQREECDQIGGLVKQQRQICKRHVDLMGAVRAGAQDAIDECQHQFRHRRWNCSTVDAATVFGRIVKSGIYEYLSIQWRTRNFNPYRKTLHVIASFPLFVFPSLCPVPGLRHAQGAARGGNSSLELGRQSKGDGEWESLSGVQGLSPGNGPGGQSSQKLKHFYEIAL